MRPPINAIFLPSGEKRGTAICRPWSSDLVVLGSKITCGGISHVSATPLLSVMRPSLSQRTAPAYSFATHQLFSPGAGAPMKATCFESGDHANSNVYMLLIAETSHAPLPVATSTP